MLTWIKGHWQLLILISAVIALWQTPVLIPLKLLVVFLHEFGHAVTIWLTGGEVVSLSINTSQGGEVTSRGGNRFLSLSAGYLGSLLFGVALLLAALRSKADRWFLVLFGLVMIAVTLLNTPLGFAWVFGLATGAVMIAIARFLPHEASDLVLRLIGLTSMIYVPYDIFSDTIARSALRSDARMLAEEFGGTTMMWGGLWLVISMAAIIWCFRFGLGPNSNLDMPKRTGA